MKKRTFFVFGMLTLMMVVGLVFFGCDTGNNGDGGSGGGDPRFNGTWTKGTLSIEITENSYTLKGSGTNISKGTFFTTGTNSGDITFSITHIWNDSWQSSPMTDFGTWSLTDGNTFIISGLTTFPSANGTWRK